MNFESFPRPKTKEELEKQVQRAQETIGADILPPDHTFEDANNLDISTIQEKYKTRYNAYLIALRAERRGMGINEQEVKHAKEWITALNNLDTYIKDHESHDNPLLREKQFLVFKKIRDFLEEGKREGYIKLPARVGKTILFNEVVQALGLKSLIATPSKIGISQTGQKIEDFTDMEYGSYYGENKDLSKNTTIITYASLIRAVRGGNIKPENIPVLILDEGHRSLGPETQNAIDQFEGLKLAFTATPEFAEDKALQNEIYSMTLRDAIEGGLLCPTRTILAETTLDLSDVTINNNGEYNEEELETYVNTQARNMAALELYKNSFRGDKAIMYCAGIKHSQDVAELFNKYGIRAESITGGTSEEERIEIFRKFKSGEIEVLTNAEVLIESYDEPKVSATFNLKPTFSFVDAEQRGSRSLTLDSENPDKWGYVVEFVDKNENRPQILFSEILDGDVVVPQHSRTGSNEKSEPKERKDFSGISIDGLKVIVDTRVISEITARNKEFRDRERDFENIREKKDGWESPNRLSRILKSSFDTVEYIAQRYRISHPDWFEIQKSSGNVSEHYHPELVKLIIQEITKHPEKRDNWESASIVSSILKSNNSTIKNIAEKYRGDHPDWFEMQRNRSGQIVENYHPELVKLIIQEITKYPEKKEGWESSNSLSKILKVDIYTVKNIAEKYHGDHPDWFEMQKIQGRASEHYHPELIKLLIKELTKYPEKKEGWENASILSSILKPNDSTIKNIAEKYRGDHPDWFEIQKTHGRASEHYHPELVKLIIQEITKYPEKKEGWESSNSLSKILKSSYETIKDTAEKYHGDHPDWFEIQNYRGQITEYYHPELIKTLKQEFNKYPEKKEGWESSNSLSKILKTNPDNIKNFTEAYRSSHPEWFEMQKNKVGRIFEYYHPELIKLIKKDLGRE